MSDGQAIPAAVRYREIMALADSAAAQLRRQEADRVDELTAEVATGQERIERSETQLEQVREGVRKRWDSAMEELWEERWMRVTPMPEPDPSAEPAAPEEPIRAVQSAYLQLREALSKRRSFLPRRR